MKTKENNPLETIFKYFKNSTKVEIWEHKTTQKHRGFISGFDEHMNIVFMNENRKYLIKGDCISCIFAFSKEECSRT